ncbi:MAG TPA: hypothetical protein VEQ67_11875, partial [Mycobacterium sp.]|nr:hypothetical protein [Mycobacterium sp.]
NLVPDGARKSRHFRRPGTSTTRSIRRYASPSSPTPRCCGRRPTSAMRSTRRGAPDPAQHDQINFYGAPARSTSKPRFVAKDTARSPTSRLTYWPPVEGTRFAPLLRRPQIGNNNIATVHDNQR